MNTQMDQNLRRLYNVGQFIPEKSILSIIRIKQYETFLNIDKKLYIAKAMVKKALEERIKIIKIIKKYDKKRN